MSVSKSVSSPLPEWLQLNLETFSVAFAEKSNKIDATHIYTLLQSCTFFANRPQIDDHTYWYCSVLTRTYMYACAVCVLIN